MHGYFVITQQCFLTEFERLERAARENRTPEPDELFFETALALAVPLILGLTADLWVAAVKAGM